MITKNINDLLRYCQHANIVSIAVDAQVSAIHYDSRKVSNESIYVARRGTAVDGHDFVQSAIDKGASVIVCEKILPSWIIPSHVVVVQTQNSRVTLAELSHAFYDFPSKSLTVIGITGTNGKTTCTFILKHILEACGERVGVIGTTGNYIGTMKLDATHTTPEAPDVCALLNTMNGHNCTTVLMEVSSHGLALQRVYGVEFKAGLFTNLTQDHLDFHHTMHEYALAKQILFSMLENNTFAVINNDSNYASLMVEHTKARVHRVGRVQHSEHSISKEQFSATSTSFVLDNYQFVTPLIGSFNVDNTALCVTLARVVFGYSQESIAQALTTVQGAPGRMERIVLSNGAIAIVDYAHTPDALEKILQTCRALLELPNNIIICVFGCGGNRDTTKRPIMGKTAEELAEKIILTNDNPRLESAESIVADIQNGMTNPKAALVISDRRTAIDHAVSISQPGDFIVVAGKGHESYQIIGNETFDFDDTKELLRYAKK